MPPMGRRSRKRPAREAPAAAPAPLPADEPAAPVSRSAARDADARADLTPLQPGERPAPLVIAAVVSVVLAMTNVILYVADVELEGPKPPLVGVLAFAGIMLVAAWGMWTHRYWAVLGFQALLAITILWASLALLVASNVVAVTLCLTTMVLCGWLFWKLVRVLGRMKVPRLGE